MSLLLIENAELLVSMDDERREIRNGALVVSDNRIEQVGDSDQLRRSLIISGQSKNYWEYTDIIAVFALTQNYVQG